MVYQTITNQNVTTISGLFIYVSEQVPAFIPIMLLTLFFIVFLGSFYAQKRISGSVNVWASMSVAGYLVTVISVLMNLVPNLIDSYVVLVCVVVTIIATTLLITQES